jgi:prepilin-type N-terminal cleavage/methylation domain-containing protein
MHRGSRSARQGFTLVELLVVMVIIGILASLLIVGVMAAMGATRKSRISTEILGLAGAMETYRATYNEYPPSDSTELQRHIDRLFPRNEDPVPAGLDEAKILVFCLSGYSSDARHPLTGTGADSFFDFDKKRVVNDTGEPIDPSLNDIRGYKYVPPGTDGTIPYVYFRKKWDNGTKAYVWDTTQQYSATPGGSVSPQKISKDFQIICAGLETEYGINDITSFQDGTEEED